MFEHVISVDFDTSMLNVYGGAIFQLICALKVNDQAANNTCNSINYLSYIVIIIIILQHAAVIVQIS